MLNDEYHIKRNQEAKKDAGRGFWKKIVAKAVICERSDLSAVAQRAKAEAIHLSAEEWIASSLPLLAMTGSRGSVTQQFSVQLLFANRTLPGVKCRHHDDAHPPYRFGLLPEPLTALPLGGWKTNLLMAVRPEALHWTE